ATARRSGFPIASGVLQRSARPRFRDHETRDRDPSLDPERHRGACSGSAQEKQQGGRTSTPCCLSGGRWYERGVAIVPHVASSTRWSIDALLRATKHVHR